MVFTLHQVADALVRCDQFMDPHWRQERDAARDASVRGWLPSEVIQFSIRYHFHAIRQCYENALEKNRGLAGRVDVKFVIGLNGLQEAITVEQI
jgi:hypothetical protein